MSHLHKAVAAICVVALAVTLVVLPGDTDSSDAGIRPVVRDSGPSLHKDRAKDEADAGIYGHRLNVAGLETPPRPKPSPKAKAYFAHGPAAAAEAPKASGGVPAELEQIAQCESGGSYTARNPSGAYGKYQIMPGTAAAHGCSLATPAGQDACATKIYAGGAGRGQWVC